MGGPPVWAGLRVRLMAPARLVSGSFTHSEEFVRVTASPGQGGGTYFGDSGGPILNGNTDTCWRSTPTSPTATAPG